MATSRATRADASAARILALIVAVLTALALAPVAALADGDPASDVLLAQNVFYPYNPPVARSLQRTLDGETGAAARVHFHIKVAIIGASYDLGVVPEMMNHPQTYANFLDQELHLFLGPHPPLLVVMPSGYGTAGLPAAARAAAAGLAKPAAATSDALAKAAISAVPKLAAAAGHRIPAGGAAAPSGGGGGSVGTVVIVALAAVALAAGVLVARHRLASPR